MVVQGLTNLLDETKEILSKHNLSIKNIKYILISTGYIPVADFVARARNINYDAGYGNVHIDPSLCIVGASWWLQRYNYDGKEKWIFLKKPLRPEFPATDYFLSKKYWDD